MTDYCLEEPLARGKDTAAWFRNEHKVTTQLANRLREQVCSVPKVDIAKWLDAIRHHFSRFRVHLKNQMRAEENDGFMQPVLEEHPTLAREVDNIKREHSELSHWLDQIHAELLEVTCDEQLLLEDVCHRIQHLLTALRHHQEREELLATFAFSQDIGAND